MSHPTHPDVPLASDAMDRLLRPGRIALVGASDKNLFSRRAHAQHSRFVQARPLALVNPRSPVVHGVNTVPSCRDIEGGIDCAFVMTPMAATRDALTDAAAAGARAAVVLSQGWAEEGPEGALRQRELVACAKDLGMLLLGPNHLGFANLWDGVAACALGLNMPIEPGSFALVSQSGAVGSSMVGYAAAQDARFSFVVTTGNEAMVTIADVVHHLVEDVHTKAIGIFAETIRKPQVFLAAARRAAELGKVIVVLKAGASELGARTAQAHTGALVGDDRVIDAMFRQYGVQRVRSLEDLICTGVLCAAVGPLRAPGVGILSVSGGACDLIADRSQDEQLSLPPLSEASCRAIAEILPAYGHPQNPLDVTGGALANPDVWRKGIAAMASEPAIGLVGIVTSLPRAGEPERNTTFHAVGEQLRASGLPGVVFPQIEEVQSEHVREVKRAAGVPVVLPSVERFVPAAARLARWSEWLRHRPAASLQPAGEGAGVLPLPGSGPVSEHAGREILQAANIPLVPAQLVQTEDEAVATARSFGGAVVLKMCSAHVAHKTELGGVELNLSGDDAVRDAYRRIEQRAQKAAVELDGVLVSPMRKGGVELLVGVTTDPHWGPVLAVAAGGAMVELLADSALRLLPVASANVRAMLGELKLAKLLQGFRGAEPADMDRLVDVIVKVAQLAQSLGPAIESIEVNPLLVNGSRIEALDVLITRATHPSPGNA